MDGTCLATSSTWDFDALPHVLKSVQCFCFYIVLYFYISKHTPGMEDILNFVLAIFP